MLSPSKAPTPLRFVRVHFLFSAEEGLNPPTLSFFFFLSLRASLPPTFPPAYSPAADASFPPLTYTNIAFLFPPEGNGMAPSPLSSFGSYGPVPSFFFPLFFLDDRGLLYRPPPLLLLVSLKDLPSSLFPECTPPSLPCRK